jgi:hypothetical protein
MNGMNGKVAVYPPVMNGMNGKVAVYPPVMNGITGNVADICSLMTFYQKKGRPRWPVM